MAVPCPDHAHAFMLGQLQRNVVGNGLGHLHNRTEKYFELGAARVSNPRRADLSQVVLSLRVIRAGQGADKKAKGLNIL
jgi:hypothetical protein